jgi:bisanhydrobacterioruberin hydratase
MKFSPTDPKEVRKFFVIFYIVGSAGMTIPHLLPYFVLMIPYALLLNFAYLIYFHENKRDLKGLLVFAAIFMLGLGIEILGVKTGKIFGSYVYGNSLGIKVFSVPLMIGINWVLLVYTTASLMQNTRLPAILQIVLASLAMTLYDLVIEQVAPAMDMWYFYGDVVPLRNYMAWFTLALVFHAMVKVFRIQTKNPVALVILLCQTMFFLVILAGKYLIS